MVKNTINRTSSITIVIALLVTAAILTVQLPSMLQPSYAQARQLDASQRQTVLDIHNRERGLVGVAPLTWSDSLASSAQTWATHIVSLNLGPGGFPPHAPWDQRSGQGENLAWGTRGAFPVATFVEGWAREKPNYVPGSPIEQTLGSPNRVYGHYTQMVWSTTTQIGCALGTDANQDYLVCRYSPSGNFLGQPAYPVGAAAVGEEETTLGMPPAVTGGETAEAPAEEAETGAGEAPPADQAGTAEETAEAPPP
jgi:hypothetical protein